jgi:hypothetical protein
MACRFLLFAFTLFLNRALATGAADLGLTIESVETAEAFYAKKWNNGFPLVDGGPEVEMENGATVFPGGIALLTRWLKEQKRLPSMEQLLPLIQHENMACRIFAKDCLEWHISDLPAYSPYFPPGSEPEKIALVEWGVRELIKRNPAAGK